jgi:hypothetical protein
MKSYTIALGLAALATMSAPLAAQGRGRNSQGVPAGQLPPAGMCRIWIDGVPPGRQPRATDCATAERNVPRNGRVIYGDNVYGSGVNGGNVGSGGKYGRNNGGVYDRNGNVIYNGNQQGTTGCHWWDINCNGSSNSNRGWSLIGRDRNGDAIYQRRVVDRNGNAVIQTARRRSNGDFQIINTQRASNNSSGVYGRTGRNDDDNDSQGDQGRGSGRGNRNHDQ